ncbi:MAG: WYL domain-containing protein [Hungatella sp.]|nr:WYL domain-containing protein [Hungatella sp.]
MNKPDFPLFSELYSCYYQVVAKILKEAALHPLTCRQIETLARDYGGGESALSIVPRLIQGDWPFLRRENTSPPTYSCTLKNPPFPQPLTGLQKSWLKALTDDPRIRLFFTDRQLADLDWYLADTVPLFRLSDFCLFDQYKDHDPFSSVMYRRHMHTILTALGERRFLSVDYLSQKDRILSHTWLPCRLEYGQRDGKFRLYAMRLTRTGRQRMDILNTARILSVKKTDSVFPSQVDVDRFLDRTLCPQPLILEITTRRNALERALLHFSCYQKKVERMKDSHTYRCTIYYDRRWETELLIQVLSFGPVIKVLGPESFLEQIRQRVRKQALLGDKTYGQEQPHVIC